MFAGGVQYNIAKDICKWSLLEGQIIEMAPRYRVGGPIMSHVNFKSFHSAMVCSPFNFYILQGQSTLFIVFIYQIIIETTAK